MENSVFKNKTCRIVLVGASSSIRNLHKDILKHLGFENTINVADLKGAIEVLEMEPIDWVICPLSISEPINALQLLKLSLDQVKLHHLKVTIIIKENEEAYLPVAFDLGLFTFMDEKSTRAEVESAYHELVASLNASDWNLAKTSAIYLRKILDKKPKELLDFNRTMLQVFPGDADIMYYLAEAQFKNNNPKGALTTLKQALIIDSQIKAKSDELMQKYSNISSELGSVEEQNTLSLASCVIIDNDVNSANQLKRVILSLGVPKVNVLASPKEAISYFQKNQDLDLILSECAFKELAGLILVQKIRQINHMMTVPIIFVNQKLEDIDLAVLLELGILTYIKKPIVEEVAIKKIIWTVQQFRLPSEPATIEFAIRQHLGLNEISKAKSLFGKLLTFKDLPEVQKLRLQAEFAYHDEKYQNAKDYCLKALKYGETSVFILSLLGKTLMKTRDFMAALRCLDLAHSLSPLNIDRICQISDCHMNLDNFEDAQKYIDEAFSLEPESKRAKESQAKLNLLSGDSETAKKIMSEVGCFKEVVAFMNNRAITLSLCSKIEEGIDLYQQAIKALPDYLEDLLVLVQYNLALAYAREGKLTESLNTLKEALKYEAGKQNKKIKSLYLRIGKSLNKGLHFKLQTSIQTIDITKVRDEDETDYIDKIAFKRGEMCCHKIYVLSEYPDEMKKVLEKPIVFNPRKTIQKTAK